MQILLIPLPHGLPTNPGMLPRSLSELVHVVIRGLDCEVYIENKMFHSHLYSRSINSGCILNYNSNLPKSTKRATLLGELNRAKRRSSNDDNEIYSRNIIINKFKKNNYPLSFINKTIYKLDTNTKVTNRSNTLTNQKTKPYYVKLPYISECFKRKCNKVLLNTQLQNHIRFYYKSGASLRNIFHPPKEKPICDISCSFCKRSAKPNSCFLKNVVYKVSCNLCNSTYIGQTHRLIKTRLAEHLKQPNSAIYRRFIEIHGGVSNGVFYTKIWFQLTNEW